MNAYKADPDARHWHKAAVGLSSQARPHNTVHCFIIFAFIVMNADKAVPPEVHPAFGISCYVSGCDAAGHGFKPRW